MSYVLLLQNLKSLFPVLNNLKDSQLQGCSGPQKKRMHQYQKSINCNLHILPKLECDMIKCEHQAKCDTIALVTPGTAFCIFAQTFWSGFLWGKDSEPRSVSKKEQFIGSAEQALFPSKNVHPTESGKIYAFLYFIAFILPRVLICSNASISFLPVFIIYKFLRWLLYSKSCFVCGFLTLT